MLRSLISRSALAGGAARAVAAGGSGIADLRRDAWGHGLHEVARAAVGAGARAVRVDGEAEVTALRAEGIAATCAADRRWTRGCCTASRMPTACCPALR